jgi:guanylate kinase
MGKIILCGPSASGKNHARTVFESKGFKFGVSYTTRYPRPGEVDGYDYHFISNREFEEMISDDMFLEYDDKVANDSNGEPVKTYYGTTKENFEKCDLFIMTPTGIKNIPEDRLNEFVVINFDIDQNTRIRRMLGREWSLEKANNRLNWESKEFKDVPSDICIKNEDF